MFHCESFRFCLSFINISSINVYSRKYLGSNFFIHADIYFLIFDCINLSQLKILNISFMHVILSILKIRFITSKNSDMVCFLIDHDKIRK